MNEYWLKVFGGPKHGTKYYDGLDIVPGRRVNIGRFTDGYYRIDLSGLSVEWVDQSKYEGRNNAGQFSAGSV